MKVKTVILNMLSLTGLSSCISLQQNAIDMSTTKIVYSEHSNSGLAIYTTYEICADSLVWEYDEARNSCHLKDVSRYNIDAFKQLLSDLSAISFSAKDANDHSVGGSGWSISFENSNGSYFSYNNLFKLSGNYQHVNEVLMSFVRNHQPNGYKLFKKYQAEPHEGAMYGEFKELPEALKSYSVP